MTLARVQRCVASYNNVALQQHQNNVRSVTAAACVSIIGNGDGSNGGDDKQELERWELRAPQL